MSESKSGKEYIDFFKDIFARLKETKDMILEKYPTSNNDDEPNFWDYDYDPKNDKGLKEWNDYTKRITDEEAAEKDAFEDKTDNEYLERMEARYQENVKFVKYLQELTNNFKYFYEHAESAYERRELRNDYSVRLTEIQDQYKDNPKWKPFVDSTMQTLRETINKEILNYEYQLQGVFAERSSFYKGQYGSS